MDQIIGNKDVVDSNEDLLEAFNELREFFRELMEEKEYLKIKVDFCENNTEWSKAYVQQLKEQIIEFKTTINSQQKSLNEIKEIKEINNELNEKISELNSILKTNEESNRETIEKIKSENYKFLVEKEKEIQELKLTINSKDILMSQSKRELIDNKSKNEENITEIKDFYENKIRSLYKEFDEKYNKLNKQNDEKIIEIRANCMRSVDKTKEEFETKLIKCQKENKDLNEKYKELRLEFEATKIAPKYDNSKNLTKNSKTSSKPNSFQSKQKLTIRVLDSEDETNESNSASKRKKLIQNNVSYLDFIRDN